MGRSVINMIKFDSALPIHLSKLYKSGVSVRDIASQLEWDRQTIIRVLPLLGYKTEVFEEICRVNPYN